MTEDQEKTKRENAARQLVMDYKNLFGSEVGQRVLADLIARTTMWSVKLQNPIDPYAIVLEEGRRSVIVYIVKKMNANLDEEKPAEAINEEKPNG